MHTIHYIHCMFRNKIVWGKITIHWDKNVRRVAQEKAVGFFLSASAFYLWWCHMSPRREEESKRQAVSWYHCDDTLDFADSLRGSQGSPGQKLENHCSRTPQPPVWLAVSSEQASPSWPTWGWWGGVLTYSKSQWLNSVLSWLKTHIFLLNTL